MQSVSENPFIASFQLSSAAPLNLGGSQNGVLVTGLFCRLRIFLVRKSLKLCLIKNYLPNDKIVEVTKLKSFSDYKLNVAKMMISLFDKVQNTVGKKDNAGDQHFFLFPHTVFQSFLLQSRSKSGLCSKGLNQT